MLGKLTPGALDVVKVFVAKNCLLETKDVGGKTGLFHATQHGHLDCVKYLVENEAEVDAKALNGLTPLGIASQNGHLQCLKYLVERCQFHQHFTREFCVDIFVPKTTKLKCN